jgi:hypothetical protein
MRRLGTLLVVIGYAALGTWFLLSWWWQWLLGLILALLVMMTDRVIVALWLFPYEQLSLQFQFLIKSHQLRQAFSLLLSRAAEQTKLLHLSVGFALVWILLAVYVLTSTGNMVAMGLVMGLGLGLCVAIIRDWRQPERMSSWFGWQIKRPLSIKETRWMAGGFVAIFTLMSAWLFLV